MRNRSAEVLKAAAEEGLRERSTIGFVGAEMASVPAIAELVEFVSERGGRASPSSLKADVISRRLASALGRGGSQSVTVAPEAGSERMRRVINKNLTEPEILRAADWLVGSGVRAMKLYFMIGLPTETHEDVDAIVALTTKIRARFQSDRRVQRLTLSVNPFAPKPWTPLQWESMEDLRSLKRKIEFLRNAVGRLPRVTIDIESPREAYYATLLSRGDRKVSRLLLAIHAADGDWWRVIQERRRAAGDGVVDPDFYVRRTYAVRRDPAVGLHRSLAAQTVPLGRTRARVCGATDRAV